MSDNQQRCCSAFTSFTKLTLDKYDMHKQTLNAWDIATSPNHYSLYTIIIRGFTLECYDFLVDKVHSVTNKDNTQNLHATTNVRITYNSIWVSVSDMNYRSTIAHNLVKTTVLDRDQQKSFLLHEFLHSPFIICLIACSFKLKVESWHA